MATGATKMATKVPFCEPCLRGHNQLEGFSWCAECEETLCNVCDKAHRTGKTTLSHFLVELKELPEIPIETLEDVDKCNIHETKPIEAFCTYHDALCCRQCVFSAHRSCEKIEYLDDIVDNAKSSAVVEEMPSVIENLKQFFDKIVANREMNRDKVKDQTQMIKDAIVKFKEVILQKVSLLEKSLINEVERIQTSSLYILDGETEEITSLKTKLQDLEQEFQFNSKFGSNRKFFCFMHHLRQKIEENDKYIQEKLSTMQDIDIEFTSDENFAKTISSMAKIEKKNKLTNIKYKPGAGLKAQIKRSPLLLNFSLSQKDSICLSDRNVSSITGIEITDNGDVLLCNFFSRKVLKYTDTGFLQECTVSSQPYGIALNKNNKIVAVTVPNEKRVVFIDNAFFLVINSVRKQKKYHAISRLVDRDNFLIGSDEFLDEIDQGGAHIRRIHIPDTGIIRYVQMETDNSLLCTNSVNLVCFNPKKEQVVFKDQHTKEARGIAIDKNGCIYIADKSESCVWRLAANGQLIDKLFADELPNYPLALKFNHDFTKLYVGLGGEGRIVVVFSVNS